jgi:limonene-1,2-epoxide hydrolase
MPPSPELEVRVRAIVDAFNRRDFRAAIAGMHADVVVEYPQSGERITGADNLLAMVDGAETPTFTIWRLWSAANLVLAEIVGSYPDGGRFLVVSLYEFRGSRLSREVDYFTEAFPPNNERAALVSLHDIVGEATAGEPGSGASGPIA